jgi:hypothetical protein
MARKMKMTHAEHVELAKKVCTAYVTVREAYVQVANKNGVTSRETKQLSKLLKHFDSARSALDSAYHAVTSNEEFSQAGHVYYNTGPTQ